MNSPTDAPTSIAETIAADVADLPIETIHIVDRGEDAGARIAHQESSAMAFPGYPGQCEIGR